MAEVLRELVVQLSLDADNYTRNMKSIASQVKQAEATFKNAGAGIKNFEKTLEGMKAKSSSLTQTLQLQSLAVEQAAKRQAEANKKLAEAKGYYDDYSNRLKQAKANVAAFARAGETAESGLKRQKQIIESCNKQLLKYDEARQNGIKLSDDEIANEKRLIEMREQAGQALEKYAASTAEGIKLLEGQVASERKMLQNAQDEAAKA
ncbi:MAG: hypothetical protein IJ649_02640, partial [Oscillospiraceae bacterium]|nr:hypothetical protein [Oscillospiraceae bacterium]